MPQSPTDELILSREAVTVADLIGFTRALPVDRQVVRMFPRGHYDNVVLETVITAQNGFSGHYSVYHESLDFVLTELRSRDGWLCMTFLDENSNLIRDLATFEPKCMETTEAHLLLKSFRQLEIDIDLGINNSSLKTFLSQNWAVMEDYERDQRAMNPLAARVARRIFELLRYSYDLLNSPADVLNVRTYGGGGPGLLGAGKGLMNAITMQALVDMHNNSKLSKRNKAVHEIWAQAFQKINALRLASG